MGNLNFKRSIAFVCGTLIMGWLAIASNAFAVNQGDPVALLQYIADNMVAGLRDHKATLKSKPQIVYQLANQYVVPYADTDEMARRVLPPQVWNRASPSERSQFKREFTKTLIRTYASALTSYEDQTVHVFPVRGGYQGSRIVQVSSQITGSNSNPIHVSYLLMRVGGAWRLVDMSVEGVSMLESFRAQFSDILSQGNMQLLLQRLGQHNGH